MKHKYAQGRPIPRPEEVMHELNHVVAQVNQGLINFMEFQDKAFLYIMDMRVSIEIYYPEQVQQYKEDAERNRQEFMKSFEIKGK